MAIEGAKIFDTGPIPAKPHAPRRAPGIAAAVLRPQLLGNLIASFPDFWYEADFSEFRVGIASAGRGIFVNEPEAIRHILVTNAENYPKDDNQLAILKPLLGDGLLTSAVQHGGATGNWRHRFFNIRACAISHRSLSPPRNDPSTACWQATRPSPSVAR